MLHTMQPSQGRIVIAKGGAARSNGSETAPALITRVWQSDAGQGYDVVNAIVFPDAALPKVITSARLYHDEVAAAAAMVSETWHETMTALHWPRRV